MTNIKQKVIRGVAWALIERISVQVVHFLVTMVLARLLTPEDYGTVALLTIFTSIGGAIVISGLGNALIQKKNVSELDFNSVFYFSLALGFIVYFILFSIAPVISEFYGIPALKPIMRVISIGLICNSINSVQNAELNRKMLFHLSFRISLISTISSAIVGLSFALAGFGVWALVWSQVVSAIAGVVAKWFIIAWRPKLQFSFKALKPLFSYGWKMLVSGLLDTTYNNLYGLLIGKWYSSSALAFVNKGRQLPELLMNNINGTLSTVAFPALSQMQDRRDRVRDSMRKMIRVSTFVVFPVLTILAVLSPQIIRFFYGDQWEPAVVYSQLACFGFALWPFHTINLQAIQAIGRSDVFFKLEIIKKIWGVLLIALFLPKGVLVFMVILAFVSGPFGVIVNSWPNRKLLAYSVGMQIKDTMAAAFACMIVGSFSLLLSMGLDCIGFKGNMWWALAHCLIVFFVGVLIYLILMFLFRASAMYDVYCIMRSKIFLKVPLLDRCLSSRLSI